MGEKMYEKMLQTGYSCGESVTVRITVKNIGYCEDVLREYVERMC